MINFYLNCDLLESFEHGDLDAMVHGCNCFHLMGAGIAGAISKRFPDAYKADKMTNHGDWEKLGSYSKYDYTFGTLINAYTQFNPGSVRPKQQLYDNIKKAFETINRDFAGKLIGIPKIGAGIAGGDWDVIAKIINEATPNTKIIVYYV